MKKISKELLDKAMNSEDLTVEELNAQIAEDSTLLASIDEELPEFVTSYDSKEELARKIAKAIRIIEKDQNPHLDVGLGFKEAILDIWIANPQVSKDEAGRIINLLH